MTKEMKRPISNITQDSIKPLLSNAVEFYTNKNREAHKCIQERDEYINYLESKLSNAKPQQALPVVPDFIGKLINTFGAPEDGKHINYSASYLEIQKELDWIDNHQKTWLTALLIGFRVEKPQLFYLKHIDMSKRNSINDLYLKKYIHADLTETGEHRLSHAMSAKGMYPPKDYCAFTQQEIDSMQTGSYELVPVEDVE
ncbi:DUF1642 domain-containing protein [Lactococcus cremoris]|uniref:DUF1642 domain-containing protein n=1 Tax=Lactococcus lactis subsp. cremoris TaxID=1359 RepID=UPI000C7AE112|nr:MULTISPECIES: DUF1642 domain-containing protein [Lactococcus]